MRLIESGEDHVTAALIRHLGDQAQISAAHYHQALDSLEIIALLDDTLDQPEQPWPAPA